MDTKAPATILIVDDDPATLYSTSRVLRNAGFEVLEAATGEQALALAGSGADLVVLDVNLPDINGFEVCRQLRSMEHTARTPVIHLSATFVSDVHKVKGLEAGADGYLTHPVEPPVLLATVNAFLRTRQAEDSMKRSEAKFRAIFDHASNGIFLLSNDLIYLEVNPAMCELLGRSREEIIGKHLSAFTHATQEHEIVNMADQLKLQNTLRTNFPLVRSDLQLVELDWSISIHSVPGVLVAVVTDVTQRKQIEAERDQLLASERAARTEAERANRVKDEFLATLSHELRSPLTAIVGWSQVLQMDHSNEKELAQGLDAIERNAKIQAQLIADLLDVSRITSGKLRLDVQMVDPAEMVNAALEGVMPAADAKNVRVRRILDPNAGPIWGDPSRLQQIIWNLVNNAVKFTPKGGNVQLKLQRVESHVEITVTDDGQGISREFLPHLFERFQQAEGGTRRNIGGLGIGLAIVKHLVELHGGTVSAKSQGEAQGAEFTVRLPLAPVAAPVLSPQIAIPEAEETGRPADRIVTDLEGLRVLVVDDDVDARMLIRRVLGDYHAEVADAADVVEALRTVDSFKPHVLVSDIGMPTQDGFDLIRQVRDRGYGFQTLPAIALTAFVRTEDRRRVLLAGYQVHVGKPVDPSELVAAIATLVGRTGLGPRPF